MGMVKYSQSYQNSKFAMSLQYLKRELRDEVDFLHVKDQRKGYSQIHTTKLQHRNLKILLWKSFLNSFFM